MGFWRWWAAKDRAAGGAEGHLASEKLPWWAVAPLCPEAALAWTSWTWGAAGSPAATRRPCALASTATPSWALTLALRPLSLSLSPAPLPPWALLAVSGCPGLWQPHRLAV